MEKLLRKNYRLAGKHFVVESFYIFVLFYIYFIVFVYFTCILFVHQ